MARESYPADGQTDGPQNMGATPPRGGSAEKNLQEIHCGIRREVLTSLRL